MKKIYKNMLNQPLPIELADPISVGAKSTFPVEGEDLNNGQLARYVAKKWVKFIRDVKDEPVQTEPVGEAPVEKETSPMTPEGAEEEEKANENLTSSDMMVESNEDVDASDDDSRDAEDEPKPPSGTRRSKKRSKR